MNGQPTPRSAFVTGGTGYLGGRLIPALVARGHRVRALVRVGSAGRLPAGCSAVVGEALQRATYAGAVERGETFVHLVGTPRPNPSKAREFQEVDLTSVREAVAVATYAGVGHFVYVSVAQPAPAMAAYVAVRALGERAIREAGLAATFLRPWYVFGPGHRWPTLLLPIYALAELVPSTRATARRLGLVTLPQMITALVAAVEAGAPADSPRIVEVPAIRAAATSGAAAT